MSFDFQNFKSNLPRKSSRYLDPEVRDRLQALGTRKYSSSKQSRFFFQRNGRRFSNSRYGW